MQGQPSALPGFEVPLHRSLTEPVLHDNRERAFGALSPL